ncbi:MAG: peptide chain release factor N(5)-glutamine methyltransferase [Candidatus Zixiibacteriota bacterium]|jgi:release factor glutamine methyltransferase
MKEQLAKFISEKAAVLEQAGIDQGKAEVELMLCHLLDADRLHLYLDGPSRIDDNILEKFNAMFNRRLTRYPLQYILQESWFYGRKFSVSPAVMVPTPETEVLCETALGFCKYRKYEKPRILDLGVGSGVISVTMANELADCSIVALDVSTEAIDVAKKNAATLGGLKKIDFRRSELFSALNNDDKFELILSNPPYISEDEYRTLEPEVLADPKQALVGGADGLDVIRAILKQAPDYLAPDGRIMFEIGYNQSEAIAQLTERDDRYTSLNIIKDLNDIDRVIVLGCER